jgi:hypothetical protein
VIKFENTEESNKVDYLPDPVYLNIEVEKIPKIRVFNKL